MQILERNRPAELSPKIGVTVDVYTTFWHPDDRRIPVVIDETKALAGKFVLVPLREKLQVTPEDIHFFQRYGFQRASVNTGLTAFLPNDKIHQFISSERLVNCAETTAKRTVRNKLTSHLSNFSRVSSSDIGSPFGIPFSLSLIEKSQTGINLNNIVYLQPSLKFLEAIDLATDRGGGIALVHPEEIFHDNPQRLLYKDRVIEAHFDHSCRVLYERKMKNSEMAYTEYAISKSLPSLAKALTQGLQALSTPGTSVDLPEDISWVGANYVPSSEVRETYVSHFDKIRTILLDWLETNIYGEANRLTSVELAALSEYSNERALRDFENTLLISRAINKVLPRFLYFVGELIFMNPVVGVLPLPYYLQSQSIGKNLMLGANALPYLSKFLLSESLTDKLEEVLSGMAQTHKDEAKFLKTNLEALAVKISRDIAYGEGTQPILVEMATTPYSLMLSHALHGDAVKSAFTPLAATASVFLAKLIHFDRQIPDLPEKDRKKVRNKLIEQFIHFFVLIWPQILSDIIDFTRLQSPEAVATGFVLGHLGNVLENQDDVDRARRAKKKLIWLTENLSKSILNPEQATKHKLKILEGEDLETYYLGNRKRYRRLDEAEKDILGRAKRALILFDHYTIGRKDKNYIRDASLALTGGQVNVLQIHNDAELSFILSILGERFEHEGTALYRSRRGRDFNIHESIGSSFTHYVNCIPEAMSSSEDLFSGITTSAIAERLKENLDDRFHVVFKREIDEATRIEIIRKYLTSTGMFSKREIDEWNPKGNVSSSMAMRLKVAAAFLKSRLIILDDNYDRRFYQDEEWNVEKQNLAKMSEFIARETKRREDIIVLLGINHSSELPTDIFKKQKVGWKRYTVRKQKFVEKVNRRNKS